MQYSPVQSITSFRRLCSLVKPKREFIYFHEKDTWPVELIKNIEKNCFVSPDFITEKEEDELISEITPHMKRLKYERDHWDDAIYLFREREQRNWSKENEIVIKRVIENSIPKESEHLSYVHILDLHKDGYIKPHIDSVRYCGNIVTGLSLLSDAVMRLVSKDRKYIFDLFLQRRSLYKLSGAGRYEFTHEILPRDKSRFRGHQIFRDRRISVVCRDLPKRSNGDKERTIENVVFKPIN
uniref:2OG-FeII_Oxy_2 domain-containing protein n=1 Tax=Strongyloides venezuelensis TaxID=75913 RepID=A0A0K0FA85_STRVS